jgi:zinc protease
MRGWNKMMLWILLLPLSVVLSGCYKAAAPESSGSAASEAWPALPEPGPAPAFSVPEAQRFELSNGVPVTFLQVSTIPMVQMQLNIFSGSASDPGGKSGLASMAASMLKEGTDKHTALEISELLLDMSSGIGMGASLEHSSASVRCLEDQFEGTLALLGEMIRYSSFRPEDVERIREQRRSSLMAEKDRLPAVGYKVFRRLIYGDSYAGRAGRGTLDSLDAVTRDDMVAWHARAWVPENASIVLVGRMSVAVARAALEEHLGAWDKADFPQAMAMDPVPDAERSPQPPNYEQRARSATTVYWVDRPGAAQSYISVGQSAPPWDAGLQASRSLGNSALGGQFTSRLNMNLREDKGYTYGARSSIAGLPQGGSFRARASVKTATTAASLTEFMYEIRGIMSDRTISDEEFAAGQGRALQGFPSYFEGIRGVLGQFASADANRRPQGWLAGYHERVSSVSREQAQAQLQAILDPAQLVVLVVGDYAAVGEEVAALGLGAMVMLDDEGDPVVPAGEESGD